DRPLLHGARAARERGAAQAHPGGRRHHDGVARGGVLEHWTEACMNEARSGKLTGGCQCGAVRYEWIERPAYASVCYCRMCQKASGQPFMAFAGGRREHLRWTRGAPSIFKSSSLAERGFCSTCGTPLTYSFEGNGSVSVTMCSFDDPEAVRPDKQYGIESKVS